MSLGNLLFNYLGLFFFTVVKYCKKTKLLHLNVNVISDTVSTKENLRGKRKKRKKQNQSSQTRRFRSGLF